jgi:hypothetical protein
MAICIGELIWRWHNLGCSKEGRCGGLVAFSVSLGSVFLKGGLSPTSVFLLLSKFLVPSYCNTDRLDQPALTNRGSGVQVALLSWYLAALTTELITVNSSLLIVLGKIEM